MPNMFRRSYTLPIPPDAELIDIKGVPSARFRHKGKTRTAPLTEDGRRVSIQSPSWYGWVNGKAVKLFNDAVASQQRLADLLRKSERQESGILDPFEEHRMRPLVEHLADWKANLESRGKKKSHIDATTACVNRIIKGCRFQRIGSISASQIEQFLADLRTDGPTLRPLERDKEVYTKTEIAAALGINRTAVASLIRRHRLDAQGNGKARRYPRATVEALREKRDHGLSIKTSNLYLSGIKAFCNFLVRDRRMAASPLVHLTKTPGEQDDRRRERRILDAGELGSVIGAASKSPIAFRELTGPDRATLYQVACTSGFRAGELAVLRPKDFDLDRAIVRLSGSHTKNKKAAEQPLPVEVVELLRVYLAGKPANKLLWPGTWYKRAAEMIRLDLDVAGIPYAIEGRDGPLYADFHCLRHSFIAMLDRSGATLKEAMQLARHSDPKLTMAIYGKARRHDLAGAVDRLPSLGEKTEPASKRKAQ